MNKTNRTTLETTPEAAEQLKLIAFVTKKTNKELTVEAIALLTKKYKGRTREQRPQIK